MSIQVALNHKTSYVYDQPVAHSPQEIRLRPAAHCRTPITGYSLCITPEEHFINWIQDPVGNYVARVVFPKPIHEFSITVDLIAEMSAINPFDFFFEKSAETFPFVYEKNMRAQLLPYLQTERPGPQLAAWLAHTASLRGRTIDCLVELNQRLQKEITYKIRLEPGIQALEETLELRSGSCRDTAWLLVNILRHLGYAARFVSGYLIQLKLDCKPLEGAAGPEKDFTDLHAWTEVFVPGAGWLGLDPTSGLLTAEGHLPLAATADPANAAPLSGSTDVCKTEFSFSMSLQRIAESPRVTKPYREDQWRDILDLGFHVDHDLDKHDVRLWMGGEPTFISADDRQSDEWQTQALGPVKKKLSEQLLRRLRVRFAPGSFLHYGQGKWYGGEELPRWAMGCYWRKDGLPLWQNVHLLDNESSAGTRTIADARAFIEELVRWLDVTPQFLLPAYEDAWHYLLQERRFPANLDPLKTDLKDPLERKRLAKVLSQGLNSVVGYCLPLRPISQDTETKWESGPWFFREETLFLLPGDSPMGFRLPLDSLPWESQPNQSGMTALDPFASRCPLTDIRGQVFRRHATALQLPRFQSVQKNSLDDSAPDSVSSQCTNVTRSALCVELRGGHLHVFMPPIGILEAYLDLVSSIEHAAQTLNMPVIIEGYSPPNDPRLRSFKITPDPGVIEVNIHPQTSWKEAVFCTEILYEEALATRLSTEKFMLDGRHSGTGGGNHITLGGPTAADSPFLRRPDLLRSLISYWQNHPSLSMLFSGLFVGPTSQAPRVDEARHESLYELAIAFQQMPSGMSQQPWLVDRLLRHFLADMTGNTHRTEFSIDKLYSPDHAAGRQGILEFRAFEMPPHPRMALLQQLLLRACVSWFWQEPYHRPLIPWGTQLHDRFMLPHFVAKDFREVLSDLQHFGYKFDFEWFAPFLEFRFPHLGSLSQEGFHLELRQAIEPWHVLGEETNTVGTSRFVDSSLERLQVMVRGLQGGRHIIAVGGRALPLHPTGTPGEFVAGVRYRAWELPSALHPTIKMHSPLVFNVFDTWSGRSMGGCTYHVAHPGGRNYVVFPVNAGEAESRRIERFQPFGHTPGRVTVITEERNPAYPMTLDLRLQPVPGKAFTEKYYFTDELEMITRNRLKTVS